MLLKKKISSTGKYAPNLDKDKDVQSGDIIQLVGDVREVETKQYGLKKVIEIKLTNEETRTLWLNQTSINNLITTYGEGKDYIESGVLNGKPMKILLGLTGKGDTMAILKG
jgi:hypothetical protein